MFVKKYYTKKDGGASLFEVVLVLGIMAVLTPVVIKFAFSDLADIRYLNIASQLKQFTKAAMAYSSAKRSEWKNGEIGQMSAKEFSAALADSGLRDTVDTKLLDNSRFRYIKSGDVSKEGEEGTLVAYLLVDMSVFGLDFTNFRKTLLFVGDNIGYVTDESCGSCSGTGRCVCSINGDWGDTYYNASGIQSSYEGGRSGKRTSYIGGERAMNDDFTAVIRIDDNMLEKEYLSDFYLYRNSQGGADGNIMERDFSLGGHDIRNLRYLDAVFVSAGNNKRVPYLNAADATFYGNVDVSGSIFFGEENFQSLSIGNTAKILAKKINFWADNLFASALFEKAELKQSELLKSNSPVINVKGDMIFPSGASLQVQTANFTGIKDSSFKVNEGDFSGQIGNVDTVSSNVKMRVPNLNAETLDVKVLTVGQNVSSKNGKTVVAVDGSVRTVGYVVIHNIAGRTKKVDIFGKLLNFQNETKNLKSAIVKKYASLNNGGEQNDGE